MKASCYLQMVPEYSGSGTLFGVKVARVTRKFPSSSLPDARILRLVLNFDDRSFAVPTAEIDLESTDLTVVVAAAEPELPEEVDS